MIKEDAHIQSEISKAWALARALETELLDVEPQTPESAEALDAATSLAFVLADSLAVLKKQVGM